ncbi:MAG: non-canonical purine NTP pyrophosphatase [Candidatus Peregrinibacteria bacterium]|nr:non-canonical purine NTP pyrophosphatase [Candidatus Peregrinibacteria bacterium]
MEPKYLLIATTNQGKFKEIFEVLGVLDISHGGSYHVISLRDLCDAEGCFVGGERRFAMSDFDGIEEDGETFKENAEKKARFYHEKTGLLTVAEDSGIVVSALDGELGVKTRRWGAGEKASDEEWIEFFMKRMSGEVDRNAKFVCSACVCGKTDGGEDICEVFEGETSGKITEKLEAPIFGGLPLSSCFLPEGRDKVYAALSAEEKNAISHRGKAMGKVLGFLKKA